MNFPRSQSPLRSLTLLAPTLLALACAPASPPPVGEETEMNQDAFATPKQLEDRTAGLSPLLASDDLELVAELPFPPGNVAVSDEGRVFFTFHPEGNRGSIEIAELIDGQPVAYPDEAFQKKAHTVLSLRVDSKGRLWLLDYGQLGLHRPRLSAIDLQTDQVVLEYDLPSEAAPFGSMLNDFQVSPAGDAIYISDQSLLRQDQAIVVVDLSGPSPVARRRLQNHPSVKNGPYGVFVDGDLVTLGHFIRPKYGVDSIALDQSGDWLYYASLNAGELYRVATFDLEYEESGLSDAELADRVEFVAETTMSDGIATDAEGNVYLTDMEHFALTRVSPEGELDLLLADERLRWPDGFGWAPDGHLYVTASALHEYLPDLIRTKDEMLDGGPYGIYRLMPQKACSDDQICRGAPGH